MPIYIFSVMEAPKAVLKERRNIQRKFLWGGSVDKKKWALASWDKICKPKSQGGMGIRVPKKNNEVRGGDLVGMGHTYLRAMEKAMACKICSETKE